GAAVSWVKIDGVRSVDAKIPGVVESTVDVLLNLKKLTVQVPSGEPKVLRVEVMGPKAVTGADVPETEVEIVNQEIPLFTLETATKVAMELGVGIGRGYEAADRKEAADTEGVGGEAFLREALAKTLEELALPARAINALKNADINLVVDLVQKVEGDLDHVKNLGEKSIDDIKTALAALGLSLGMRIDPNVLGALGRGGVPR